MVQGASVFGCNSNATRPHHGHEASRQRGDARGARRQGHESGQEARQDGSDAGGHPWGGVLPVGPGPLPQSSGGFLTLARDAHAVWTAAPWSAAVLARENLAGTTRLWELQLASRQCVNGWMHLSPNQVAYKLLVTWKVCFWPEWSALPYPDFVALDDDPHSFDQYSLWWSERNDPALYGAWFATHVRTVAQAAHHVPCLYSLAPRLVFVWWQNVLEHKLPGYTRVRLSRAARKWLGHRSRYHSAICLIIGRACVAGN